MLTSLLKKIQASSQQIQDWITGQWQGLDPTVYLSCDIRHSGHKIAVIDTNLFPAGFNNLCKTYSRDTAKTFHDYFQLYFPQVRKILILGEDHTRNKYYLKNLFHLMTELGEAGFEVRTGMLGEWLTESTCEIDVDGRALTLHKVDFSSAQIHCQNWVPDILLSNNDFSTGVPAKLKQAHQIIIPSPELGWHERTKNQHFEFLGQIIQNFATTFKIDPWQLMAITQTLHDIDIMQEDHVTKLAQCVDSMITLVQKKYDEYGLTDPPYVYIKSNSGTYGMGLTSVFSGDEILGMGRRRKNKLLSSKRKIPVDSFLIQEGIPTVDFYSGYPIEPVIYVVGKKPVGGFFRVHESKNQLESLNAPGMSFSCLCMHKLDEPHETRFIDCQEKESVVEVSMLLAQLAALAASQEVRTLAGCR